jgi:hypothetical protein
MAILFNGTTSYLNLPNTTSVNFGASNFCLSAWISVNNPAGPRQIIIGKDVDVGRQFALVYNGNDDANRALQVFYFRDGSSVNAHICSSGPNFIKDSNYHHILGQRVGTGLELYLDGSRLTGNFGSTTQGVMNSFTSDLRIGGREYPSFNNFFSGSISEVAIWSGSLSQVEITNLASGRLMRMPLQIFSSRLIHYWPLDDVSHGIRQTSPLRDYGSRGLVMLSSGVPTGMGTFYASYS